MGLMTWLFPAGCLIGSVIAFRIAVKVEMWEQRLLFGFISGGLFSLAFHNIP